MAQARLYFNPGRTRFYLLPTDAVIPRGDLVLRALAGERRDVDAEAVALYEVPEDEARALAREEMERVLGVARGMLSGIGDAARRALEERGGLVDPALRDKLREATARLTEVATKLDAAKAAQAREGEE